MPRVLNWLELPLHYLIKFLINKFDECWVPDFPLNHSLAGDLVHKYRLPSNCRLIGPLSRFESKEQTKSNEPEENSVLAIISGPEPQKTILEKQLVDLFSNSGENLKLYNGKPGYSQTPTSDNISIHGHCFTQKLKEDILHYSKIITRPGYSTIMDMYTLGKSCLLIPTPGQTEQEYLAILHKKRNHVILEQKELTYSKANSLSFPNRPPNGEKTLIFRKELKDFF